MKTSDFDYDLPPERIAQEPLADRTAARMMVVDRRAGTFADHGVRELPGFLHAGERRLVRQKFLYPLFGFIVSIIVITCFLVNIRKQF